MAGVQTRFHWTKSGEFRLVKDHPLMTAGDIADTKKIYVNEEKYTFARFDEFWKIQYKEHVVVVAHTDGLSYLSHLLKQPHTNIGFCELESLVKPQSTGSCDIIAKQERENLQVVDNFSRDKVISDQSLVSLRQRLKDLNQEREKANREGNMYSLEAIEKEIDQIQDYFSDSTINGRSKFFNDESEKLRKRLYAAISRAIKTIRSHNRVIANHLKRSIIMGRTLAYDPDTYIKWEI